jgi:hypothetical protein
MINWPKTITQFGIHSIQEFVYRQKIVAICDQCKVNEQIATIRDKRRIVDGDYKWICTKCLNNSPEHKQKLSKSGKKLWTDPNYANKVKQNQKVGIQTVEYRQLQSKLSTERMKDPTYRAMISQKVRATENDPTHVEKMRRSSLKMWENEELAERLRNYRQTEEYRKLCSVNAKELWKDPVYKEKQKDKPNRTKEFLAKIKLLQPKVSKLQDKLYSILDDLKVKYFREWNDKSDDLECKVGCYSFDCVIPREGKTTLLVDVHGEYWHSLNSKASSDAAKSTYIALYFKDKYEYKVIWEHEFLQQDRIISLLKYWLGVDIELVDFNFEDVKIERCSSKDCQLLLSKYHYLVTAGRGGICYGAYLNNELVAVSIFSPLVRQNIRIEGLDNPRELSRLCIHPKYQKYNFASWFVSRCIKLLPIQYDGIISYCDTGHNHYGAIYKACNFELDGEVLPDYWYANSEGWVMHKKTLYNHAVRNHKTERLWAEQNGYSKVWGDKKLRFVYKRRGDD